MKRVITLLAFTILSMVALGKGHKNEHSVSVLAARMNIVHFKLDRESIGATIEVYNEKR